MKNLAIAWRLGVQAAYAALGSVGAGHSREDQLDFRHNLQLLQSCRQPPTRLCRLNTNVLATNPEGASREFKASTQRWRVRLRQWQRANLLTTNVTMSMSPTNDPMNPRGKLIRSDALGHWTHSIASKVSK